MRHYCSKICALLLAAMLAAAAAAQQPIDIFPDNAPLGAGFVRIGSWNLRHINLEEGAREFLPGANDDEDFAILVGTFAKAVQDLGLDLLAVQEHQPRAGEPNRLLQIVERLNGGSAGPWRSAETNIPYDNPSSPFSNLQFAVVWNSSRIAIDPASAVLLSDLRQPRNPAGELTERTLRIPWLVPVKAGAMEFDLLVLHLKSGGEFPQGPEVNALEQFVRQRQSVSPARHLIVCGDWNMRPDQATGRARLRQMMVPNPGGELMRILTLDSAGLTLGQWEELSPISGASAVAALIAFSHFNPSPTLDTFLDHMAISRTFDEVFDHPIEVTLANGAADLHPGVRVARPLIPESSYIRLTDHLPVVLTLRTLGGTIVTPVPAAGLKIAAAIPNPVGNDVQDEEVRLHNAGGQAVPLAGWKIGDSTGTSFWKLESADGTVQAGTTIVIRRNGRAMSLNNNGDTIVLVNPAGVTVDQKTYGDAPSGLVFTFN
jgi:endonuclease/exonuclease/phosphatase family metal-dependent hydrolase